MESAVVFGKTMMHTMQPPLPLSPAHLPIQCPELDLSVTLSPERPAALAGALKKKGKHTRPRQVRFDVNPESRTKPSAPCEARSLGTLPITKATPQPCSNQSAPGKPHSKRKEGSQTDGGCGQFQPYVSAQTDGQLDEGAELNTTLALKAEIQKLEEAEFDPNEAVREKLQRSTLTQEYIRARASEALNFPRSQNLYQGLVSVSLSHDEIINQVLQDRPSLALPTASFKSRPRSAEGPDLLTFYSPQLLFREMPLLPGDQIPLPRLRPEPRPAHTTFHLHQRHRQWEA
ncbi:protein phosphatase 1 regulatory subunit 35 [Astyanax mexicanus]|uniref:Protein phosphatase 1 regulatory subunit 35 n=2 Tax=Astyanax mexicanus TaxID=7994 RepID=A0A8B9HPN7_ASTMX|nr:protein phosphatase 1 regulatory subunit 35 [Astyanax mexicanus]XP_022533252.1 protein phosphatase 1 regulatory subunit 35 [Astyanax mexicanus]KAG9269427.1 protein phosphatase 1 regulatory subunit 35 [Astyanax mexicanus]